MSVRVRDLVAHLRTLGCEAELEDDKFMVVQICHVEDATHYTVSWHRGDPVYPEARAGVVIAHTNDRPTLERARVVISHDDPRGIMRRVIEDFFGPKIANVHVGGQCRLHPSTVLGADGQSYQNTDGLWRPFPQVGGLRIEDHVDIGACATIMRGTVGDTVIEAGTKIGNGVNIGHDVRIGRNVLVIAGASIAGWVRVGDGAKIWQGALIKNGVRIGAGAQVAMGAVVLQDVPAGETWGGNPACKLQKRPR